MHINHCTCMQCTHTLEHTALGRYRGIFKRGEAAVCLTLHTKLGGGGAVHLLKAVQKRGGGLLSTYGPLDTTCSSKNEVGWKGGGGY